ncbi:hypothetical protein B9Q13_02525 [Candidatus Marsarchaeota G2 archaeon ECH_B_SAG-G16]|uniref:Uncharacterized protein n=1 Tax=Candidatus Marsarchaeota G2 archaeon ECH_B_SAG-G16 TaxID=1978167 RepID=A0A2R6C2Y2_9ARCH|nr:MAG: hypothetical protein B9Q13_02525 [Candidatus Marsarchaeota G2 archaeon ECH_B_SAG-G16]
MWFRFHRRMVFNLREYKKKLKYKIKMRFYSSYFLSGILFKSLASRTHPAHFLQAFAQTRI